MEARDIEEILKQQKSKRKGRIATKKESDGEKD